MSHPSATSRHVTATEAREWLGPLSVLAAEAGNAILDIACKPFTASGKADGSPVTAADLAADAIIAAGLARIAPGVPVVSEESLSSDALPDGSFFLVDPLDGTREFVACRDEYTVNIALISHGVPILGIVGAPARHTLWRGIVGHGADRLTYSPECVLGAAEPIKVRTPAAGQWVAAVSRSHPDKATDAFLTAHEIGQRLEVGSALKFCWIAEGRADIYPRFGQTSEWDVAAGHAVVIAAGGSITCPDGSPLTYGRQADTFLVPGFIAMGAGRL